MTKIVMPFREGAGRPDIWSGASFAMATASAAWALYLSTAVLRCIVYGFRHPAMLIERHALTAVVAVGLAGLLFLFINRYDSASIRLRLAAALLGAVLPAILLSVINFNVMYVFAPQAYLADIGMDLHAGIFGEVLDSAAENYFIFSGWAALYTAVSHAVQIQDVRRRAAASDAAARFAELRALRSSSTRISFSTRSTRSPALCWAATWRQRTARSKHCAASCARR